MKKLFSIFMFLLLLTGGISYAGSTDVTLEWDACTDQDVVGYRLYQSNTSGTYTTPIVTVPVGIEIAVLVQVPNGTWYWVLTAYDGQDRESGYSNEVTATFDVGPGCLNFNLRFR